MPQQFGYVEDSVRGILVEYMNEIIKKNNLSFHKVDQQVQIKVNGYKYCDIVIWEKQGIPHAILS